MLFGPGIFIAGGATIVVALLDKTCEEFGIHWLGTAMRLLLPIAGFGLGVYFIETNPMLGWLK
ncbi:hypothetical protein [Heyndrickxia sporothermodurans]|uniref:hypothetical protein n=1 Tax=Heyndrickxia sporothermodurans TaxID=46224 RepID=UPI002E1C290B|nr:hypothetical protein [Heyndrickxia sporothermodurans]MED3697357.1 hypothetical protein [Heyndrickxia sporothermodurans]